MVNKEETIQKMTLRYKEIYPISGKKSLNDCFFSLHGKQFFQFVTKDKKVHLAKACLVKLSRIKLETHFPVFCSIFRFLTQPVKIGFIRG